jgi:glycosyltransferase involved in cell wall biosynthesis
VTLPARARTLAGVADISVIIPTRDRAPLLAQALASVRALEADDLAIEIIVVDDGATDDTQEVARRFGARILESGGRGAAGARNVGIDAASAPFSLFLDDDDVCLPGHMRPHLRMLRRYPELEAVMGQIRNASPDLEEIGDPWPVDFPRNGDLFRAFLDTYPQCGAVVVRTRVRDSVGTQDESLIGDQDWDWHLRLAAEHRVGFVPVPCILFRQRLPSRAAEDLEWRRLGYLAPVFFRNLRRVGVRRWPSPRALVRMHLHHRGAYEAFFARCAEEHARAGERRLALRAIYRAGRASPLHAAYGLLRAGPLRNAIGLLLPGRGATAG